MSGRCLGCGGFQRCRCVGLDLDDGWRMMFESSKSLPVHDSASFRRSVEVAHRERFASWPLDKFVFCPTCNKAQRM